MVCQNLLSTTIATSFGRNDKLGNAILSDGKKKNPFDLFPTLEVT